MRNIKQIKKVFGNKGQYSSRERNEAQKRIRKWWYKYKFKKGMNNPALKTFYRWKNMIDSGADHRGRKHELDTPIDDEDYEIIYYRWHDIWRNNPKLEKDYKKAIEIARSHNVDRLITDTRDFDVYDLPADTREEIGWQSDPFVLDSEIEYIKVNGKEVPMNIFKFKGKSPEVRNNWVLYWGRHWNEIGIKYIPPLSTKKSREVMYENTNEKLTNPRTGKKKKADFMKRNIFYLDKLGNLSGLKKVTVEIKQKNNPYKYILNYDHDDIKNKNNVKCRIKYSSEEKGKRNEVFAKPSISNPRYFERNYREVITMNDILNY